MEFRELVNACQVVFLMAANCASAIKHQEIGHVTGIHVWSNKPTSVWVPPPVDPHAYLPVLPGRRPTCATPTETFCTAIEGYPRFVLGLYIWIRRPAGRSFIFGSPSSSSVASIYVLSHYELARDRTFL
jgi:hypothetical protein